MKAIFTGDWHLGLAVESFDRTEEVQRVIRFIVGEAIDRKVDFLSIGGDLTDNNTPRPEHIAFLIEQLNRLEIAGVKTFVMRGNHEAIATTNQVWAHTPLEEVGYKRITFVKEPICHTIRTLTLVFLPHVTRNQAVAYQKKSAQEYLEWEAEGLCAEKTLGNARFAIAITHQNLQGPKPGTEQYMLRQSELQVPKAALNCNKLSYIVNSHIHTPGEWRNVILPGSPVCTSFGDLHDGKGFLLGEMNEESGEWAFERVRTPFMPLQEFNFDFVGRDAKAREEIIQSALSLVEKDSLIRLRIFIEEEKLATIDEATLKSRFEKTGTAFVKQVDRVVKRTKQTRDKDQKPGMKPIDAAKLFLEGRKPVGWERKLNLACVLIADEVPEIKEDESQFQDEERVEKNLEDSLSDIERVTI